MSEGAASLRRLTAIAIADTDSYVKWGAALLDRAPAEWDRRMLVLDSPLRPSDAQLGAALAGTAFAAGPADGDADPVARPAGGAVGPHPAEVVGLAGFTRRIAELRPDVVLLTARGPAVKVLLRAALQARGVRPVFVTGLPGISIPATRRAIGYRTQCDLFVVHSRREVREFGLLAERMRLPQRFALATLPFLADRGPQDAGHSHSGGDVIFAAQAKVPVAREERLELLSWLAEAARRAPGRRVVVKVRGLPGEPQTHVERWSYPELLAELDPAPPANLVVAGGPMAEHLDGAAGLVTVSSTAVVEAVAAGVPSLVLDDFGVSDRLINSVFVGSGLLAGSRELVTGRFRHPDPAWLDDNYLHDPADADWAAQAAELVAARDAGMLPLRPQRFGAAGGPLRRAWDRKRALGSADRSLSGLLALGVGIPARGLLLIARELRARRTAAAAAAAAAAQSAGVAGGVPSSVSSSSQNPVGMPAAAAASPGSASTRSSE